MLQITFQGAQNWFDISGELYRLWDSEDNYYFSNRPTPFNAEVSSSKGEWNGKLFDVQHIKYEGWYLQFIINEEYVHSFADIRSCEIIEVNDFDNGVEHTLNIDVIENLEIDISPTGNGTVYVVSMTYRTNKIIINKGYSKLRTNAIDIILYESDWFLNFNTELSLNNAKIAKLSETKIAVLNSSQLKTYELVDKVWTLKGLPLSIPFMSDPAITSISENRVVIILDAQGLMQAYEFDNVTWSAIGNSIDLPGNYTDATITGLSSTQVATFDSQTHLLSTYEFDETNWALVGNALNIAGTANPEITKLTSTKIALLDSSVGNLVSYDFDGSDWSSDISTAVTISGSFSMASLSSTRICYFDNTSDILRVFDLTTSWTQYGSNFSISGLNLTSIAALNEFEIVLTDSVNDDLTNYNLSKLRYYTDFALIPYYNEPEKLNVLLSTGKQKQISETNRKGLSALIYFDTDKKTEFELNLINAIGFELVENVGTSETVTTGLYVDRKEITQAGEDYHRIITYFITSETVKEYTLIVDELVTLLIGAVDYLTDEELYAVTEQNENINVTFPDGTDKLGMSVVKKGYRYRGFFSRSDAATLIENYLKATSVQVGYYGGGLSALIERRAFEITDLNDRIQELKLNCITSITRTYFNLNPSGTYSLVITRTGQVGSPWTYTTDFPLTVLYEDGEQETVDNNQGLNISAKNITKQITRAIFYVNRATANLIKYNFELGGVVTIAGTTVLETRSVNPNELAPDLYEVIVDCVTGSGVYYPNS